MRSPYIAMIPLPLNTIQYLPQLPNFTPGRKTKWRRVIAKRRRKLTRNTGLQKSTQSLPSVL